jgi:hypothetical protein
MGTLECMKLTNIAAYVLWIAAAAFLMRFELHSDDAGVIAFFILLATCLLGSLHPRRAWQWALLVGPAVPAADLIFGSPHSPFSLSETVKLFVFVVVIGLAGAYLGVLLRKTVSAAAELYF